MPKADHPVNSSKPSAANRPRRRRRRGMVAAMLLSTTIQTLGGCGIFQRIPDGPHDTKTSYHSDYAMRIEYPEVAECATPTVAAARTASAPVALADPAKIPALEMTLSEAVQRAVADSPILRRLGSNALVSPQTVGTVYDPALAHADPLSGVEAALAAFDAQY